MELIIWSRKPISEPTEFDNVVKWGTGAVNCGECMVPWSDEVPSETVHYARVNVGIDPNREQGGYTKSANGEAYTTSADPAGRFPANVLCQDNALGDGSRYFDLDSWATQHGFTEDGWAEAAEAGLVQVPKASAAEKSAGCEGLPDNKRIAGPCVHPPKCAKCGKWIQGTIKHVDRPGSTCTCPIPQPVNGEKPRPLKNPHPTCKPVRLFAFLISLLCPTDGLVLDPFTGSGTTGVAAIQTGRSFIGVELEEEYVAIAEARCKYAEGNVPAQQAMEL